MEGLTATTKGSRLKIKKKVVALFAALLMSVGLATASSSPASAAASGTVECFSGGQVVGMWVEVTSGGSSGWATLTYLGGYQWDWYYGGVSGSGNYYVAVGCGGTPENWGVTTYGPTVSGNHSWLCFPGLVSGQLNRCHST